MPVYRGRAKFERALASLRGVETAFRRIIISLNSDSGSSDASIAAEFLAQHRGNVEVIQTGSELPWMAHQYFWLNHLERTGESSHTWIMWFAHDDQLRAKGIKAYTAANGSWPLVPGTIYLGPWGMRYDPPGGLYEGPADAPVESWTSFPIDGPLRLSVGQWISQQFRQPTYINMSGCVTQMSSFQALRDFRVEKPGGMRIEMATAAAPLNHFVEEFPDPLVITHTSPTTDRTTYASVTRQDDRHMVAWLANYLTKHPAALLPAAHAAASVGAAHARRLITKQSLPTEDWRRRTVVDV
jgi:hypothetical protein